MTYWLALRASLSCLAFAALFDMKQPAVAGDYDHALHVDHPEAPSLLDQYLDHPAPKLGGAPRETAPGEEE